MGLFMSVSRESNFFFKHRVDQKYFLYIHEIKDTCIRDLKKLLFRVTGNPVKMVGKGDQEFILALDILGTMFQDCAC